MVKLAGPASGLNFQPHLSTDTSAIVSTDASRRALHLPIAAGTDRDAIRSFRRLEKYHWAFVGAPTL